MDGGSQVWKWVKVTAEYKKLMNVQSGKVLDIVEMREDDGAPAQIWDDVEGIGQQWRTVPVSAEPEKEPAPAKEETPAPKKRAPRKPRAVKETAPAKEEAPKAQEPEVEPAPIAETTPAPVKKESPKAEAKPARKKPARKPKAPK